MCTTDLVAIVPGKLGSYIGRIAGIHRIDLYIDIGRNGIRNVVLNEDRDAKLCIRPIPIGTCGILIELGIVRPNAHSVGLAAALASTRIQGAKPLGLETGPLNRWRKGVPSFIHCLEGDPLPLFAESHSCTEVSNRVKRVLGWR